ncbi:MAG: helix-turn-helix transcriptional regulator [Spirochaetota bacterium]
MSGEIFSYPHLILAHTPLSYLVGPVLYLYFTYYITNTNTFQKIHLLHFIPFAIAILALLPFYLQSGAYKIELLQSAQMGRRNSYFRFLSVFASLSNVIYCFMVLKKSFFLLNKTVLQKEVIGRYLIFIVFSVLFAVFFKFVAFFSKNHLFLYLSLGIITLNILAIYLLSWRYPHFLQELNRIVEQEKKKYVKSHITSLDTDTVKAKLESFMKTEKPYLEDDVSLESIAKNLQLSTHQLSQFLNQVMQKSFYQYINEFRIQEAMLVLKQEPELNILNVAYKVGFNSKSSFNTTFKKITGKTPSEFRKSS